MGREVRRYVIKVGRDNIEVRSQGQTGRGAYYTMASEVVDFQSKTKGELKHDVEQTILRLNPRAQKQTQ